MGEILVVRDLWISVEILIETIIALARFKASAINWNDERESNPTKVVCNHLADHQPILAACNWRAESRLENTRISSVPLPTHSGTSFVEIVGIEPTSLTLQRSVAPLEHVPPSRPSHSRPFGCAGGHGLCLSPLPRTPFRAIVE